MFAVGLLTLNGFPGNPSPVGDGVDNLPKSYSSGGCRLFACSLLCLCKRRKHCFVVIIIPPTDYFCKIFIIIEKVRFCGYNTFMIKIKINGEEIISEALPLKELLPKYGMEFPCGGKGICGRCKIICGELPPSNLDKRFFSEKQLNEGARLACDKTAAEGIKIFFDAKPQKKTIKLEYCNIAVIIAAQTIEVGILEEELIDSVVIKNTAKDSIGLRSLVGKECVELFERYGVAKADTIAVATNSFYAKMLLGQESEGKGELLNATEYLLPAETLYLLPFIGDIGGDFLCKALQKSFPRLIVDADELFVAGLFTEGDILCLSHKNVSYAIGELPALQASLELLLRNAERPLISLYGEKSRLLAGLMTEYSVAFEDEPSLEPVAKACNENRIRNQILKLRNRVSIVETVTSDEWQGLFLSAND